MKRLNIASTFTDINELYIAEAADMPYASAVIPKKQRGNAFTRFLNSGIGVAMICGIVAIGVTLGVLMMGWNDDPVSPVGNAVTSTAPETSATATSFAFSYEIAPVKDDYEPGEILTVTTEVENLGDSFTVKGSSQAFHAAAWLIPHGSTDIHNAEGKINGNFAIREDYVIQTIETGDIGHHRGSILLPETASGIYDLVLSYGDEYQVFENAVRVGTAVIESFAFSYSISPIKDYYESGETITVTTEVKNLGDSFTVKDGSQAFYAAAWLIPHGSNGIRDVEGQINGIFEVDHDAVIQTIETGDIGRQTGSILLSETASGDYDLVLSYGDAYQVFENAVRVRTTVTKDIFRFTYEIQEGESSYHPHTFRWGDILSVSATVENLGAPFEITGHSLEFSPRISFKHEYRDDVLEVVCAYPDDILTRTVETGEIGHIRGYVTIPEDIHTGLYDLYLSYGDTVIKIAGALYVSVTEEYAIAAANEYMAGRTSPIPLENMRMDVSTFSDSDDYYFSYTYFLGKLPTDYRFTLKVNPNGRVYDYKRTEWDPEAYYAIYTDEDVNAAHERLNKKISEQLGDHINSSMWITVLETKEEKLYVYAEIILDCEHGPECNGLESEDFVCLGHEHYSFEEEVTKITP